MWRKSSEAKGPASHTPAPVQEPTEKAPQASSPSSESMAATADAGSSTSPANGRTASAPASTAPAEPPRNPRRANAGRTETTHEPAALESASTISAGLKIKGEITGTSDLTVDGETQGKIRTNGRVTVGPKGNVNDIDAREIVVYGTVHGNLNASESVRLGPSCHVEGSVLTPRISIDDGASLHGNVEMTHAGEAPEPGKAEQPKTNVRAASAHEG